MPSFVFNSAKIGILNATIDLDSDTFYACLVTSIPAATVTTRTGLAEASGGTYAPQLLSGTILNAPTTATVRWTFTNPSWTNLTTGTSTPLLGMVICKRVGSSLATSDPVIAFLEFNNNFTPSGVTFQVDIPNNTGVLTATFS